MNFAEYGKPMSHLISRRINVKKESVLQIIRNYNEDSKYKKSEIIS